MLQFHSGLEEIFAVDDDRSLVTSLRGHKDDADRSEKLCAKVLAFSGGPQQQGEEMGDVASAPAHKRVVMRPRQHIGSELCQTLSGLVG